MIASVLFSLVTFLAPAIVPQAKNVVATELYDQEHVLLIYSDLSMAVAPIATLAPDGTFIGGTTIDVHPTSDKLVARWKDANGIEHEVVTDCVTMKPIDCAIQHSKILKTMVEIYPVKKD
jgi:hypothetical protein